MYIMYVSSVETCVLFVETASTHSLSTVMYLVTYGVVLFVLSHYVGTTVHLHYHYYYCIVITILSLLFNNIH